MSNGKEWSLEVVKTYNKRNMVNKFNVLENLIKYLLEQKKFFKIVPIENLFEKSKKKINVSLRYDVDADINTAIKCSKLMEKNKIFSTFYLLHTGVYYRNRKYTDKLVRHSDLKENILNIKNKYSAIGLHIDPLYVDIKFKQDGTKEVLDEINWLNSFCSCIKTISTHNSCGLFGAENFEIFEELTLNNRKSYTFNNIEYPLGKLSLQNLDLIEVNYPIIKNTEKVRLFPKNIDRKELMKMSVHDNDVFYHKYNINIWCCGKDQWIVSNNRDNTYDIVKYTEVIDYLDFIKYDNSNTIVFNLHPVYFAL